MFDPKTAFKLMVFNKLLAIISSTIKHVEINLFILKTTLCEVIYDAEIIWMNDTRLTDPEYLTDARI